MGIVKSKTNTKSKSSEKQEKPAKPMVSVVDSLLGEKENEAALEQTPLAESPSDEQQLADTNNAVVSDQTEELTEAQRAEMRMNNAKAQLTMLGTQHTDLQRQIETRQAEIKRLQDEHDQAETHLSELLETGQRLETALRDAKNRQIIVTGTGHEPEAQAQSVIDEVTEKLQANNEAIEKARILDEQTRQALDAIPLQEDEITAFQTEVQEVAGRYHEMECLYAEQHEVVGKHRASALKNRIEDLENIVKDRRALLDQSKSDLKQAQESIYQEMSEWQDWARLLQVTHGIKEEPNEANERMMAAWITFVETLHREVPKAQRMVGHTHLSLVEALALPVQNIVDVLTPHHWYSAGERNARGEVETIETHRLVEQMKVNIKNQRGEIR